MASLQAALQVTSINTQGRKVLTVSGKGNRLVICSPSDSHNSTEEIPKIPFPHTDLDLTKYMTVCFTLCMGVVPLVYLLCFEMTETVVENPKLSDY